jgi:hypothetical protein
MAYSRRGMGDCLSGQGPLQPGQSYCTSSPSSDGATCFSPWFPFVGQSVSGQCVTPLNIPDPWAKAITVGLVSLAVFKFAGRR